ncbi:WD40-repeat-containing domain protein [Kalaharituber pfeilii]|nr:WD40-repeat-containing domain protein [Kalaharituber pfeilii]
MKVTTPFTSTGCNRHPAAADWRRRTKLGDGGDGSGLLAYAARRGIALWDPEDDKWKGVRRVLKGHGQVVNVVKWVNVPVYRGEKEEGDRIGVETVLVSGSVAGGQEKGAEIGIWRLRGQGEERDEADYVLGKMERAGGSVNDVVAVRWDGEGGRKGKGVVMAAACADGTVLVWEVWGLQSTSENGIKIQANLIQTITTKPKFFPLALSISSLPGFRESLILAVGGSTTGIQIYVSSSPAEEFILRATLTGHENWVRSLAFTRECSSEDADLLLASGSQDKYIRLWRVHLGRELPAPTKTTAGDALGMVGGSSLSNKAHRFTTTGGDGELEYSVTFEALLMGHEDWIYTVRWRPRRNGVLQLLSASADNSISVWSPDEASGIWLSTARLGEISDQKGSSTATGSPGGLWIGLWSPEGTKVAALGKTGTWRVWGYQEAEDRWVQGVAVGGHVREVTGVNWGGPGARYLLSTSLDQTTRLWARWVRDNSQGRLVSWHEFSRPQIHGYDINCVAFLPELEGRKGGCSFVSGADEKLLRVFAEPKGVAGLLDRLGASGEEHKGGGKTAMESMPEGADQPVLGLSNKAVAPSAGPDTATIITDGDGSSAPSQLTQTQSALLAPLTHPPLEDHLSRQTLWPETEKLYGHGYEISTLAPDHSGTLLATACRASSVEHAVIRCYDTRSWRELKPSLGGGHSLSVLRMEFSKDDERLLSVGRDRAWVVYSRTQDGGYVISARQPVKGGHLRVIWDGKWAPVVPGAARVFATASRDKTVRIWREKEKDGGGEEYEAVETIKFEEPVRAVGFLDEVVGGKRYVLAVGTEGGKVIVYEGSVGDAEGEAERNGAGRGWKVKGEVPAELVPDGAVTEMWWRPGGGRGAGEDDNGDFDREDEGRELAVASEDGSVRVYRIIL